MNYDLLNQGDGDPQKGGIETEKYPLVDCPYCAGCDYNECRRDTVLRVPTYDLERMNFLEWYRTATLADLAIARKNNASKLEELKNKYANEIELMNIFGRW